MSSAGNLIDFDGVGPIMGPIQLSSQLSCMCCILIFIKMLLDTQLKRSPYTLCSRVAYVRLVRLLRC